MFTKKKSKDKQENEEPAAISSPQPATSYGGQPDVGGKREGSDYENFTLPAGL